MRSIGERLSAILWTSDRRHATYRSCAGLSEPASPVCAGRSKSAAYIYRCGIVTSFSAYLNQRIHIEKIRIPGSGAKTLCYWQVIYGLTAVFPDMCVAADAAAGVTYGRRM